MAKVAVFDSGLGSLSILRPLQKMAGLHLIYFADQESFPYGTKSPRELRMIINATVKRLDERFSPDLIVVASNTPSLLLTPRRGSGILGVLPPLREAVQMTSTCTIAVLATRSVVASPRLRKYIRHWVPKKIHVVSIDASPLVELVESGRFVTHRSQCRRVIQNVLRPIAKHGADVATLSSTHLPFLLPILEEAFPTVRFLDPADSVAARVQKVLKKTPASRRRLEIFASGNAGLFQKKLAKIGIRKKVSSL